MQESVQAPEVGSRWLGWGRVWRVAEVTNGTFLVAWIEDEQVTFHGPISQFRQDDERAPHEYHDEMDGVS